jgi:glycosyltransferase involved in cell wall biosynthesis
MSAPDVPTAPRFSVVIPAFNCERYIRESLESVLQQSYPPLEIIVVDDGSTDNTAGIVQRLMAGSAIVYVRQHNQGPARARNHGVEVSRGDWIAFLDADDIWHSGKLAAHCEYISAYPEIFFFWSDMNYIDERGGPRKPKHWGDPFAQLIFNRPICPLPSSVVMRKEIFGWIDGFDNRLHCYEDLEFFVRVVARFPGKILPQELFAYRCHDDQLHSRLRLASENWPLVHESLVKLCRSDQKRHTALRRRSASLYSGFGRYFLRSGDLARARYFFRQSFAQKAFYWKNLRRWGSSYLPGIRHLYRKAKQHAVRV